MAVTATDFFKYTNEFFNYRRHIFDVSRQTIRSNRVDLNLFKGFIESHKTKTISGTAVIDFQYYLKDQRRNCGASINRKIFTLRSYGNFLKLHDLSDVNTLPFHDVPKIRSGYRKYPDALPPGQIKRRIKLRAGCTEVVMQRKFEKPGH